METVQIFLNELSATESIFNEDSTEITTFLLIILSPVEIDASIDDLVTYCCTKLHYRNVVQVRYINGSGKSGFDLSKIQLESSDIVIVFNDDIIGGQSNEDSIFMTAVSMLKYLQQSRIERTNKGQQSQPSPRLIVTVVSNKAESIRSLECLGVHSILYLQVLYCFLLFQCLVDALLYLE